MNRKKKRGGGGVKARESLMSIGASRVLLKGIDTTRLTQAAAVVSAANDLLLLLLLLQEKICGRTWIAATPGIGAATAAAFVGAAAACGIDVAAVAAVAHCERK
ncbi:hypothetical protein C8J57DRAFT_1233124 [Mycena rebaudengoi]|nr:hypothetical protein C8J57DRAFT_1233124 [Mycena rebaudengoi]